MSTILISRDVRSHFDFLFDRGFGIRSISEDMGNWVTTLESSHCLLRIINEHGEISLDFGPKSRTNNSAWFSINAIVFYITEGQTLLEEFKDPLPGVDQQYQRLGELLKRYWDQIILMMGNDFADHEENLGKAGKTVTRLYIERYKANKAGK